MTCTEESDRGGGSGLDRSSIPWRLLVLARDEQLRAALERFPAEELAVTTPCADVERALAALRSPLRSGIDAILAEGDGPGHLGLALLAALRHEEPAPPILLISTAFGPREVAGALDAGADDHVRFPFAFEELAARIGAVLRRQRALPVLRFGDLQVDLVRRSVRRGELRIDLSPRELDLLRVLAQNSGRALSRPELFHAIWGTEFDPGTTAIEVLVNRLRKKLDRTGRQIVVTIPGVGYALAS